MVLHARAAANVAEDQHLDGGLGLVGTILGGFALRHVLRWEQQNDDRQNRGAIERNTDEGVDHGGVQGQMLEAPPGRFT